MLIKKQIIEYGERRNLAPLPLYPKFLHDRPLYMLLKTVNGVMTPHIPIIQKSTLIGNILCLFTVQAEV